MKKTIGQFVKLFGEEMRYDLCTYTPINYSEDAFSMVEFTECFGDWFDDIPKEIHIVKNICIFILY